MRYFLLIFLVFLLPVPVFAGIPEADHSKNISASHDASMSQDIDPENFLQEPFDGKATYGTFDAFVSSLYALKSKLQVYGGEELVTREVHNIYPPFYTPTVKEILDMVAWQTGSRWKFDKAHRQYEFIEYPIAYPFTLTLADGWRHLYRGMYVGFAPQYALVGMDIYYFGHLTVPKGDDAAQFYREMRKFYSTLVLRAHAARSIPDPDKDMVEITVSGSPALYWSPKENIPGMTGIWRQWSVMIDGNAFLIVSAMDDSNRNRIWKDVDNMVASFSRNQNFQLQTTDQPQMSTGSELELVDEALNILTSLQSVDGIDKTIFIPIKAEKYAAYLPDKDLGPYISVAKAEGYDAMVLCLVGGLPEDSRIVYFKANEPESYGDISQETPYSLEQIRSALKKPPPHPARYRLHLALGSIMMKADNGTPIFAYQVKYIKAQPQPCKPDGSAEVCF